LVTAESLHAIQALLRLVLQREHEGAECGFPVTTSASPELKAELSAIPTDALMATIQRHRLEILFYCDPLVGGLLPEIQIRLKDLAHAETKSALALASLTREMAARFDQAGIQMLVIKGIPLALETTSSISARGRGDLDLFVDPKKLPEAVDLLEQNGFVRMAGDFPNNLYSIWGRYSRWAGYEISLFRKHRSGTQWIDLHWSLSNVRGPLPRFTNAWRRRQQFIISEQPVSTLCHLHAFQHACAHAAKDQWMCLRNLVDIDRLVRVNCNDSLDSLRHFRLVRWSCLVTHAFGGSDKLLSLIDPKEVSNKRALREAHLAQIRPWRGIGDQPWKPQRWFSAVARTLSLSITAEDQIRTLLYHILLPAAFSDPQTGKDRGLAGLIKARIRWFRQRARESQRPNPVQSA